MKKRRKFLIIGLITLFGIFLTTDIVHADPETSEADITFTEGEGAPDVLDPSDPTTPYDPDPEDPTDPQDDPTGETGPLTLDFVSSIDFGTQSISAEEEDYNSTTIRPFIQVSDRRGTGEGWNVTASMSDFSSEGDNTLVGARLSFTNSEIVTNRDVVETETPTPEEFVLVPGGATTNVVTAGMDEGLGSWITRWFPTDGEAETNDNVTLNVPAGAATEGDHTATITWELTAGPGSETQQ